MSDREYLEIAFKEGKKAFDENTWPIGAVIVGPLGNVLIKERNRVYSSSDITGHAEIRAIKKVSKLLLEPEFKNKCTLYTTVEPCIMCSGAISLADIKRVVWLLNDDYLGAFRYLKKEQKYRKRFDLIESVENPFPDLAIKQEELMEKAWHRRRSDPYTVSCFKKEK